MYALIERLRMKFLQLQHAVTGGDDRLVNVLDRDIEQSLYALLEVHASTPSDMHQQMRFVCELIRSGAGDAQSVRRGTEALIHLLDRNFIAPTVQVSQRLDPPKVRPDKALADDGHLYQVMLDSLSEPVVLVGRDLKIIFANHAFCDLHRILPLELIGRHFNEFHFGNGLAFDFDARIKATLASRAPCSKEKTPARSRQIGWEPVELQPVFIGGADAIGVMIVFRQSALHALALTEISHSA